MKPVRRPRPARPGDAPGRAPDVIVDTGFLVALYGTNDRFHLQARRWLAGSERRLLTVEAVLGESAHLLPARLTGALARAAAEGLTEVHALDIEAYRRVADLAERYRDLGPDWTDLALVWLAEATGVHRIATLDARDFGVYRIHGRKAFDIVWPA